MSNSQHASDGSNKAPRLEIFQSTWAMRDLPGASQPWSTDEVLSRVLQAGFTGLFHWVEQEADFRVVEQARELGLLVGVGFPDRDGSTVQNLARCARGSGVSFMNAQVHDSFVVDAEALRRIDALYMVCDELEVPLFIETHRGTVTQDLLRTVSFARQMERMRFTLDASHFVVAGEVIAPDSSPKFGEALAEIIARSSSIHARVSNGEQVQVDVGDGTGEVVRPYVSWWEAAFRQWSTQAQPGNFFPFVCELGPAPYSITLPVPSESGGRVEISDRFAQALVFKKIAEERVT